MGAPLSACGVGMFQFGALIAQNPVAAVPINHIKNSARAHIDGSTDRIVTAAAAHRLLVTDVRKSSAAN